MTEAANNSYLLIHTMTITESDCILQAQFFHACSRDLSSFRLVGRRMRLRIHPALNRNRNKVGIQNMDASNLRTLMKRHSSNVRHHLRAVHITTQAQNNQVLPRLNVIGNVANEAPVKKLFPERKETPVAKDVVIHNGKLSQHSTPQETVEWLSTNRFEKFIETFERFSGDDMLRMTREDFIQICGSADGIRLHNAIHLKTIAPKLKIYVCRENSSVYNAVFLSSHNNLELLQKLSSMMGVSREQVRDIYMEGPHSIHVQLNNDLLRHIKEETMFSLQMIQEHNSYVFLLKRAMA